MPKNILNGQITWTQEKQPPEVFCKNRVVLRNFAKFTGKHLWQSLFFNKVADLRPATLFKKRLCHRCFPVNFMKFLKHLFYITPLVADSEIKWLRFWLTLFGKHKTLISEHKYGGLKCNYVNL